MVRGVTAKLVLFIALLSLPLQGMINAGMLGCQMESGTASMGVVSAAMSDNGMSMGERCKTSPLGAHGAGGCKVCPSCTLCPATACINSHASTPVALALFFADVQMGLPPLLFPSPIKHPPRLSSSLG